MPADPGPRPRTVGYASVFYPGTSVAAQAVTIKLGVAEERTGVDFPLSLVPTAKVEGSVVVPEGVSPQSVMLQMIGSNPQGMHARLVQTLDAERRRHLHVRGRGPRAVRDRRAGAAAAPPGGRHAAAEPAPRPAHWARADVTLDGQDISGVSLTLQPGMVVAGRIQLEGTSAQPPDLSRIRINLLPVQAPGEVSLGPDADSAGRDRIVLDRRRHARPLSADGQHPLGAARYRRLAAEVVGRSFGRDTLDTPVDLREGTDSAVITFTDRRSPS